MSIDKFDRFNDSRGDLFPLDYNKLNFKPLRMFWTTNVPRNMIRGGHAHYKTQQYLMCLQGVVEVLLDNGKNKEKYIIKSGEGIYVSEMVWDEQKYLTGNEILCVLCSTEYDIEDYITDYDIFKNMTKGSL